MQKLKYLLEKYKSNIFPSAYIAIQQFNNCSCNDTKNVNDCLNFKEENESLLKEESKLNILDSNSIDSKLNYEVIDSKYYFVYKLKSIDDIDDIVDIVDNANSNKSSIENISNINNKSFKVDNSIILKKLNENLNSFIITLKTICHKSERINFNKNKLSFFGSNNIKQIENRISTAIIKEFNSHIKELCPIYFKAKEMANMMLDEYCADKVCSEYGITKKIR